MDKNTLKDASDKALVILYCCSKFGTVCVLVSNIHEGRVKSGIIRIISLSGADWIVQQRMSEHLLKYSCNQETHPFWVESLERQKCSFVQKYVPKH